MKKTTILITFVFIASLLTAQVTMQPLIPQSGAFQKSQLWNVLVVNSYPNPVNCYLVLSLQDRETGTEVMSATSPVFLLDKGAKQLNAAVLTPIQYTYVSFTGDKTDDFLSVGSYTACYKLMGGEGATELAEACLPFDVSPLSPPILITPADSSSLPVQPSMFTWQPPAPLVMFQQLHYELVIAEILPGQKPEEAIELNAPVYMDLNIPSNVMNYTGAYPSLEKGKWYAWQVVAQDGTNYAQKTETWVFSISTSNQPQAMPIGTAYVKLKRVYEAGVTTVQNSLKIQYNNEVDDGNDMYKIIELQGDSKVAVVATTIDLKPGQNFIDIPLNKNFTAGKNYMFELTNSRDEKWNIKFSISK